MDCSLPGFSVHGIFQAKRTGAGCHFLLQGIFPIQESSPGLLHCRQTLYPLSQWAPNVSWPDCPHALKSQVFRLTTSLCPSTCIMPIWGQCP